MINGYYDPTDYDGLTDEEIAAMPVYYTLKHPGFQSMIIKDL